MEAKRIKLHRTPQGWLATWLGPESARIVDLFGTDTIPTAFTARATPEHVKARIEALNPGYVVGFWGAS